MKICVNLKENGMLKDFDLNLSPTEMLVVLAALYDLTQNEERHIIDRAEAERIRQNVLSELKGRK